MSAGAEPSQRRQDPAEEDQLILVDGRNRALMPLGKTAVHERGLRHRAFSIFLVDREGRTLLQRRHPDKYHSGGLWANSCCGHPRWGESIAAAARRRLGEELGLRARLQPGFRTHYEIRFANGLAENEAVTVFFGRWTGASMRPDPGEIAATRWLALGDLDRAVERRPHSFAYWLRHYVTHHRSDLEAGFARAAEGPEAPF